MKQKPKFIQKIKKFFDETDIYTLTYTPPMVGLPLYILFIIALDTFVENYLTGQYLLSFGTSIIILLMSIGTVGSVYKKELPWIMGKTYKGNWAVVSGSVVSIILILTSVVIFLYGLKILITQVLGI